LTAADVVSFNSASTLVSYLAQRDASPALCDLRSTGPHVSRFEDNTAVALVRGLTAGEIPPGTWLPCVGAALNHGSRSDAGHLIDAIGDGYRALATERAIETSPALQARIAALQSVYIERPSGQDGDPIVMARIFDKLRELYLGGRFGRVASNLVGELLGVADLEQGRYGGSPVDAAAIDAIAARKDANLLHRFADRLPLPDLRRQAQRQLVRLAISDSPFAEVRADSAAVEERVLREGNNRVSLVEHPVTNGSLDATRLPGLNVLVRQDVFRQTATLSGYPSGGSLSVLPDLRLEGALRVDLQGVTHHITICPAQSTYDPTPCIGTMDVTIENPLALGDAGGVFHFRDKLNETDAVSLTREPCRFALDIDVGGRRLVAFGWPLRFERPADLILGGRSSRGPDLKVAVTRASASLFLFTITSGRVVYRAVLEKADLSAFHVVSRGAGGATGNAGLDGLDGTAGLDGMAASCPSSSGTAGGRGGDGTQGGRGGDGDNGSDGGDILVTLDCGATACSTEDLDLIRHVVLSEGGPGGSGGPGGRGGRGGRGGSGGSGTSCIDALSGAASSLSGGMDGASGSDGSTGSTGADGASGRPGRVRIEVSPPRT
jgi:hypothetical protein